MIRKSRQNFFPSFYRGINTGCTQHFVLRRRVVPQIKSSEKEFKVSRRSNNSPPLSWHGFVTVIDAWDRLVEDDDDEEAVREVRRPSRLSHTQSRENKISLKAPTDALKASTRIYFFSK